MQIRHAALALAICLLLPAAANATGITNMADIPYDITIVAAGTEEQIPIEAGRTWHSDANPLYVKVKNRRIKLEPGASYAIWKDGSITMQDRGPINRGSH